MILAGSVAEPWLERLIRLIRLIRLRHCHDKARLMIAPHNAPQCSTQCGRVALDAEAL